jgi:hypothetical protein
LLGKTFSILFSYSNNVLLDLLATKFDFLATGFYESGLGLYRAGPTVSNFMPLYASAATFLAGIGAGTGFGITAIFLCYF